MDCAFDIRHWKTIEEFVVGLAGADELSKTFDASPLQYKTLLTSFEIVSFGLGPPPKTPHTAFATVRRGWLNTRLFVTIPDRVASLDVFWHGINDFAKRRRVTQIDIEAVGGRDKTPAFPDEVKRDNAHNYVLYLDKFSDRVLAKNHLRNVKKAAKAGARLVWRTQSAAMEDHLRLWHMSMDRRSARGEHIASPLDLERIRSFVRSGYARIFQAELNGRIVSSILIVKIGDRAFYDTGGTSAEGMQVGTGYFVMYKIIHLMREYGCSMLSMGVTSPGREGLIRFKQGFGCVTYPFEVTERRFNSPIKALLGKRPS